MNPLFGGDSRRLAPPRLRSSRDVGQPLAGLISKLVAPAQKPRPRAAADDIAEIQVLVVLEPANGHSPVAGIHQRLRPGAQPPDLATIYRTVTTLVDQGCWTR